MDIKKLECNPDFSYEIKESYTDAFSIKVYKKEKLVIFTSLYYHSFYTNCKVGSIEGLQIFTDLEKSSIYQKNGITREILDEVRLNIFKQARFNKLTFLFQSTRLDEIRNIKRLFDMVYLNKVPIGYYSGFQYHGCFMTPKPYAGKETYEERIKKESCKLIKRIPQQ